MYQDIKNSFDGNGFKKMGHGSGCGSVNEKAFNQKVEPTKCKFSYCFAIEFILPSMALCTRWCDGGWVFLSVSASPLSSSFARSRVCRGRNQTGIMYKYRNKYLTTIWNIIIILKKLCTHYRPQPAHHSRCEVLLFFEKRTNSNIFKFKLNGFSFEIEYWDSSREYMYKYVYIFQNTRE